MTHNLKINTIYFEPIVKGIKTFEIRKNDRNFQLGDYVYLNELNSEMDEYTGRSIKGQIIYITDYEQKDNYIVFSFKFIEIIMDDSTNSVEYFDE